MVNVINDKKAAREVVRISLKSDKGPEKAASFILKSMIMEDKEIYLKYIIEANKTREQLPGESLDDYVKVANRQSSWSAKELTYKMHKILNFMQRMLNDSLDVICGGFDKVPEKYRGKRLTILCGLPYRKDTVVTTVEKDENGTYVKKTMSNDNNQEQTKRAIVVKLYLAEEIN